MPAAAQEQPAPMIIVWSYDYGTGNIVVTDGSLSIGSKVTIQLLITDAPEFNGFEVQLTYDPAFLSAQPSSVDLKTGTLFGSTAFSLRLEVFQGEVMLSVVSLGQSFSGNGALVQITFTVFALGVSPLGLSNTMLVLGSTLLPDPLTQDGYFQNQAEKMGPIAEFEYAPANPLEADIVTFDASSSFDPDNFNATYGGVREYRWDFGDGDNEVTNNPITTHMFVSPGFPPIPAVGNFSVRLIVMDSDGFLGFRYRVVEVDIRPLPPPLCSLGRTIAKVPDDCPTVESAVDAVVPGGTVEVGPGAFRENILIDKPLTLTGADNGRTIIDGDLKVTITILASNVRVTGLSILNGGGRGVLAANVLIFNAPGTVISNNLIGGTAEGPSGERVSGIKVVASTGIILEDNRIENATQGILLLQSPHSSLRRNIMLHNDYSFSVTGGTMEDYIQDVDSSNTVDGKPIVYVRDATNPLIPQDAGYLAFVNSRDITIGHRTITGVGQGLLLAGTSRVSVDALTATRVSEGIVAFNSTGIVVKRSHLGNELSTVGIRLIGSSGSTFLNNTITVGPRSIGIDLVYSDLNLIRDNIVLGGAGNFGISVQFSHGNVVERNLVSATGGTIGLSIINSVLNKLTRNQIIDYSVLGIGLVGSPSNLLDGNTVKVNSLPPRGTRSGIVLFNSPRNLLRNNQIQNTLLSLRVVSDHSMATGSNIGTFRLLDDYIQDIGPSNSIDGKPTYYLVNQGHMLVPATAGYVTIVNSAHVTISGVDLSFPGDGITIIASSNIMVANSRVTFAQNGIWALSSTDVTIIGNHITDIRDGSGILVENTVRALVEGNFLKPLSFRSGVAQSQITPQVQIIPTPGAFGFHGIRLYRASNITIRGNYISNYEFDGISLQESTGNLVQRNTLAGTRPRATGIVAYPGSMGNLIVANTIANNAVGFQGAAAGNTLYHNNFIDNRRQVTNVGNTWDNGMGEGNFWSDYEGSDTNGDGVGDTNLPHLGLDNYPLTEPWQVDGLNTVFAGRGAWPEEKRFVISTDEDQLQTLFAKVTNQGSEAGWVQGIFTITSADGWTVQLTSDPVWAEQGATVTVSAPFTPHSGVYSVVVEVRVSSDAFQSWKRTGTRTFSFVAVR